MWIGQNAIGTARIAAAQGLAAGGATAAGRGRPTDIGLVAPLPTGVLGVGDLLWLPPDASVPDSDADFSDADVELYGRDFALPLGHLVYGGDAEAAVVAGKANIIQALQQRIATKEGELVLHPDYGMRQPLVVGVEGTPSYIQMSGMEVARTVREDPRVASIRQVIMQFVNTANTITLNVVLIGPAQRDLPLNLVIPEGATAGTG
jgi:hypothetical protein